MDRFDPLAKKAKVSGGAGAGAGAGGGRGRGRGRKMFIPPREAPVFYPSADEFQDCLGYVQKIKPIAEQYGICKIVPPRDWQPPFVLDINQLKVQPRIQKLNELDAKTRIKLNFISLLMKFWQLQGRQIRAPSLRDDKLLDVYSLRQLVQRNGGYEQCTRTGCWSLFAKEMKIEQKNGANLLQLYYESFIYPYDVYVRENPDLDFSAEKLSDSKKTYRNNNIKMTDGERNETVADTKRIKQNDEDGSANEPMIPLFNIKDVDLKDEIKDIKENKELKKLQFFGAGPKMAGLPDLISIANKRESKSPKQINKSNIYNCLACDKDDDEKLLLICSKCYTYFHTYCLKPALREVPKHEWHCPFCLASKIRKFHVPYGFETSTREYSLREFGEMADQFKCRYFRREAHEVSNAACEQEFWKIVQDLDETVTVEYGADLHSMEHGSGFPTVPDGGPHDVYVHSSWNLNNLPVAEESVLGHIGGSISGMKIPWMYVGMCFSSFCWHNEDHWSYSINYLHWGEAKTWYGIPGQMAEQFEAIMKDEAAELFESQPDLLHQLVTIMNPNIFIDRGVQVSRLDQQAGEFVITFPRAYHCGFNQGYNFAEAVNFAPADWIKIGRECISHYAQLKRFCVFSHDELVCRMSFLPSNTLSFSISEALLQDLISMTDREKRKRKELLDNGIKSAKKVQFEAIPDNERMCHECKTTCFLSAIKCNKCNNDKLYCINHWNKICKCPPSNYSMQYRYTVDDLLRMVISINKRQLQQRRWLTNVKLALNPQDGKSKVPFAQIKKLLGEAKAWKSPKPEFVYALTRVHSTVENCIDIIKQMQNSCKNDAGVHAIAAAAHVDLLVRQKKQINAYSILDKVNSYFVNNKLPIRLKSARLVPRTFNCRTCVIKKSYIYKIAVVLPTNRDQNNPHTSKNLNNIVPIPILELHQVLTITPKSFDTKKIQTAIKQFVGFHDFRTFMSNPNNKNSKKITQREITAAYFRRGKKINIFECPYSENGDYSVEYWDFFFESKGFLYRQVRRMVSSLLALGIGTITDDEFRELLEIPNEKLWPPKIVSVPGRGLYLNKVEYSEEDLQFVSPTAPETNTELV